MMRDLTRSCGAVAAILLIMAMIVACKGDEESKRLRAENESLRAEVARLKQTPSQRIEDALSVLNQAATTGHVTNDSIDRLRNASRNADSILALYPDAPESSALRAALSKTQHTLTVFEAAKTTVEKVNDAMQAGHFQEARRIVKANHDITEESRTSLLKQIREMEQKPVDTTLKLVENFPGDWVGRRIRISGEFLDLSQTWTSSLPEVRGFTSPEGMVTSFDQDAARKWVGFQMRDASGEMYQRLFARKDKFQDILVKLSRRDPITITGTVVEFGTNNWSAIIVDDIQRR